MVSRNEFRCKLTKVLVHVADVDTKIVQVSCSPHPVPRAECRLSQDINFVAEMLESLSRDAEIQLQRHTEHIARKNKSQETLYDVVTSINMSRNVQELLTQFLHTMKELADARGAAVFLEIKKDTYSLVQKLAWNPPQKMAPVPARRYTGVR